MDPDFYEAETIEESYDYIVDYLSLQISKDDQISDYFSKEDIDDLITNYIPLTMVEVIMQDFVLQLYQQHLQSLPSLDSLKDPKTRLQEYLQSQRIELPTYRILQESDQGHHKTFEVECHVQALNQKTLGVGKSKRKAEQLAANEMLSVLGIAG